MSFEGNTHFLLLIKLTSHKKLERAGFLLQPYWREQNVWDKTVERVSRIYWEAPKMNKNIISTGCPKKQMILGFCIIYLEPKMDFGIVFSFPENWYPYAYVEFLSDIWEPRYKKKIAQSNIYGRCM